MKRAMLIVLVPLVILVPSSCHPPGGGEPVTTPDPGTGTGGGIAQTSNLFLLQSDGSYLFTTSDSAYWGPNGYTLWALPLAGQQTFAGRDVILKKNSGNLYAGFGIVFCQYDTGDPALGETMLVVMINGQKQYSVGEATGSVYTPYTSSTWISAQSLNMGYGVTNEVEVKRDAGGVFTVLLNGTPVMTFHDGRTPLHVGGGDGYLAVISPQDDFPNTPVTITYEEKSR